MIDNFLIQAHVYESPEAKIGANEKCCGLEKISKSLSCCNYVGYNPNLHVCADVSHQQYGKYQPHKSLVAQSLSCYTVATVFILSST